MATIWKSPHGAREVEERYRALLARWPVANRQSTVPTRAGETFVIACGPEDAPPLVLLHGSASTSFMWTMDSALWSQHFRVYAVDIIGEPGLSSPNRPTLASGAYVEWLDDVLAVLKIEKTALVGLSLGGYLAIDYATRRPERVSAVAALCPGGVGRHKNVLLWALPLLMLGDWGRRKVNAIISGPKPPGAAEMPAVVTEFLAAIYKHFRVRTERLPQISDEALKRLTMPVLVILGAKDAMIDSADTRRRIVAHVPHAQIQWHDDQGHFLRGQAPAIDEFLRAETAR